MAGLVLVAGTTTLLAPGAGVISIALATVGAGEFLGKWLETNRISFFPSVQDASTAAQGVTLYGYAPLGDTLTSSIHDDRVFGFSGNDYIVNRGGSDAVFGGLGIDTLDYSTMTFASTGGIIVDATAGDGSFLVHHHSDTDVVTEVEHIIATAGADAFVLGNYGANIAGGGHIETIDAGAGDDVALLLNEGGAGPRRVAIDGGSGLDTVAVASDAFNSEVDFDAGTVRYQGGVNAQFTVANFEAARGGDGSDVMLGSDRAEYLLGNSGADRLFGGGADDFIFFDAEDTEVYGGTGRDVAVALGQDGVTVDMAAQGLECVIGCAGADTFVLEAGESALFAAGGDENDTFTVKFADAEVPKILWGGAGADTFNFEHSNAYENWWDYPQLGLAVVTVAGLTDEMFASLTRDDLGLGDMDLSLIDAIVINPDADDQYLFNGGAFQTSGWDQMYDPQNFGVAFGVRSSTYLGESHAIQSLFGIDVFQFNEFSMNFEYFDVIVSGDETVDTQVVAAERSDGLFWSPWDQAYMPITPQHPLIQQAIAQTEAEAAAWFAEYGREYQTHWASDAPSFFCNFFVVGGSLDGSDLNSVNSLAGALPENPGPTPFDWLLAA